VPWPAHPLKLYFIIYATKMPAFIGSDVGYISWKA